MSDFDAMKYLHECLAAQRAVILAAKKVHKKVTSQYRTQRCVLELKDAVKALEALEKS